MKFFATLALIGSAVASEYGYDDYDLTRSYATAYKKLDIDHVVEQLSWRNEDRVREVRDETELAVAQLKFFHRNNVDERVDDYEQEIAGLRQALADALAAKRAALAEVNGHMIDEQHHLNEEVFADVDALNYEQEELIHYIIDSDQAYDHTTIVYWLEEAGKAEALTWETYPKVPTHPYETYLSWNARGKGDQYYASASQVTGYPVGHTW